jgi:hypothetical protein
VTLSVDLVGPLDRLETLPSGIPELTLGWEAIKWASKYLKQPNGPNAGKRFEFVPSQVRFILWWYALDEFEQWLFRRAVRRLAKGSGKSPFAAVLALIELCAPVRLDHFDQDVPGGCVGKQVAMPLVQIAATAESQTENTMRMVRAFAPKGSRIVRDHGLDPGLTQYYKSGGGKLHVLTSSSSAAEGGEATFVVGDEPEHWLPGNGGPTFASTLADNLAKSGSRMLETCNAWEPGAGSVAEGSFDAWVAQEEGRTRGKSRILYDARVAAPDTDMTDDASLTAALEHVYGDCWWQTRNLQSIKERIWDTQAREDDSRRKYLNQPVASEDAWTTTLAWSLLSDPAHVVPDGAEIVLFFDGSLSRDATALMGCEMSSGHVFTLDVWEPDTAHTTKSVVDVNAVDSAVDVAFERFQPVAFFGDVREWESFVKITWPKKYGDRLLINAVDNGDEPQPIAWDMRSKSYKFAEACELTQAEINDKAFTHDGDSRVARHIGNAREAPSKGRVGIRKESPDSPKKIDAAVCVIGARMVRRIVLASPEWQKRARKSEGPQYAVFYSA